MGANSKIEWCSHSWNPWIGCTKVSPGCLHCYAESLNRRWKKGANWGKGAPRSRTSDGTWQQVYRWNKDAAGLAERPRVFCASLADWLDDEVPIEWLADLMELIHKTPNLDWLLLTKRPENWESRIDQAFEHSHGEGWQSMWTQGAIPENIWVGTSVEDQTRADERIPELIAIPAKVHFLSCEPLLSPVALNLKDVEWCIVGGESGQSKRAFNADWARQIRFQCEDSGTAFFMKQMDKVQPIPDDLMIREFPAANPTP